MVDAGHLRAELQRALATVEGLTFFDEVWSLHEAVRQFPVEADMTVVEIGSWKGRSTIGLARGVKARGRGRVYAIDPHTGGAECVQLFGEVDTFDAFMRNLADAGVADLVQPIRTTSHEARPRFDDKTVQVLFVDGSHLYENITQDISDWTSALADQAVVAFNDPLYPSVYRTLRELVLRHGSPYRHATQRHNTLFFQFRRQVPWTWADSWALVRVRLLMALHFRADRLGAHVPGWLRLHGRRLYERLLAG